MAKGRTAQAIERFERAVRLDPWVASTYQDLARAYGATGRLEQAVAAFRRALALDADSDCWLPLAVLLDGLGRHGEARPAYAEGLSLDPEQWWAGERLAILAQRNGDVEAETRFRFWGDTGVRVFGPDAPRDAPKRVGGEYLELLRSISPDAARVTDKMPFNFSHLGLIRQVFPRATIVHCRRHPIDTCLSIYTTPFAAALAPAAAFASDLSHLAAYYRQYERLMAHWRRVLPAERFIEVDYEALVADPATETRRLVAACGLVWDDACLSPHLNRRRIATASRWQASRPICRTAVGRWRRYEPWLGEPLALEPHAQAGAHPAGADNRRVLHHFGRAAAGNEKAPDGGPGPSGRP